MTDWAPKESVMGEDQYFFVQLIDWLKREYSENMAARAALQIAAHLEPKTTNTILEEKTAQMTKTKRHVDAEFRRVETALKDGSDYRVALRALLKRHE